MYCKQRCINRFWSGRRVQPGHLLTSCLEEEHRQPQWGVPTSSYFFLSVLLTGTHAPHLIVGWTWTCKACYYGPAGLRVAGRGGGVHARPWPWKAYWNMKILFYELFVYSPFFPLNKNSILITQNGQGPSLFKAYIQRLPIGMERNFVCSWCRHNCRSLSLSALTSWFMKSIIGFNLKQFKLYAIIYRSLIIDWYWVWKIYFAVSEEILTMLFLIHQPF